MTDAAAADLFSAYGAGVRRRYHFTSCCSRIIAADNDTRYHNIDLMVWAGSGGGKEKLRDLTSNVFS